METDNWNLQRRTAVRSLLHASLVAREYGLPAVVASEGATARLRDGMIVTVDGQRRDRRARSLATGDRPDRGSKIPIGMPERASTRSTSLIGPPRG